MSHVVMKKSLAKALMDAGMEHFDLGGMLGGLLGNGNSGVKANYTPPPQQNLQPVINNLQGEQQDTYNQQKSLANTLLNQSQGQGPNPAQAMLNNNTGNNIAAQAALMASQRGASANPGEIARMAAQQGGALQQTAVGQGAALQAEQQLAAQRELQAQQQNMQNQSLQGQTIDQNALAAQNKEISATNSMNADLQKSNASSQNNLLGGLLSAAGTVAPLLLASKGGEISFSRALLDNGGAVPGKASVAGDSEKNDNQPTLLSPKEVVLPRSVTMAGDAPEKAAEFMRHLQDVKAPKGDGYGKVLEAKKSLKERVEHLEKLCRGGYAMGAA